MIDDEVRAAARRACWISVYAAFLASCTASDRKAVRERAADEADHAVDLLDERLDGGAFSQGGNSIMVVWPDPDLAPHYRMAVMSDLQTALRFAQQRADARVWSAFEYDEAAIAQLKADIAALATGVLPPELPE